MKFLRMLGHSILILIVMLGLIMIVPAKRYLREQKEQKPSPSPAVQETAEPVVTQTEEPELVNDENRYVYYELLDEDLQDVYRDALLCAEEGGRSFSPSVLLPADQIRSVLEAMYYDHAELFWLDISYSYMYDDQGLCHEVILDFNEAGDDLSSSRKRFEEEAQPIIDAAQELPSDYEKERYVHDVLLDRIEYDEQEGDDQSAYGALVRGRAVCAGYARAFQYIMNELGVPAYYITGTAEDTDHAWNIIYLDGEYYNVDLTWDDLTPDSYMCFNLSDDSFADHIRSGLSMQLPACPEDMSR